MKASIVALVFGAAALPLPAAEQHFNQFVGFGDSTVDSGWYRNLAFPTGNTVIDAGFPPRLQMAAAYRRPDPARSARNCWRATSISPPHLPIRVARITRTAARVTTRPDRCRNAVSTVAQIHNYLAAAGGSANGNALYLIGSGGNDVTLYVNQVNAGAITLGQGIVNARSIRDRPDDGDFSASFGRRPLHSGAQSARVVRNGHRTILASLVQQLLMVWACLG
jgi:phospholipase/lecithinase/hemolysin